MAKESNKDKKTAWSSGLSGMSSGLKSALSFRLSRGRQALLPDRQANLDRKLVYSLSRSRIPSLGQLKYAFLFFSKSEVWILRIASFVMLLSLAFLSFSYYREHFTIVPADGGLYRELTVSYPHYVNPLYSVMSDVDADASRLIFSSLYTRDAEGNLKADLAESMQRAADGKSYEVRIRRDAKWHDGRPVKADDVVFTFEAIKDQRYRSPLRQEFAGVSIEKIDDYAVKFVLESPYSAFADSLVFGILPFEQWSSIMPENALLTDLNIRPIGSGPYRFASLKKSTKNGDIREYLLEPNQDYYGEKARVSINFISVNSFEEAVADLSNASDRAEALSFLPYGFRKELMGQGLNIRRLETPQASGIFFNTKGSVPLQDKLVRRALVMAVNRQSLAEVATGGESRSMNSTLDFIYNDLPASTTISSNVSEAQAILDKAGWTKTIISDEMVKQAESASSTESSEELIFLGSGEWRKKGDDYLTIKIDSLDLPEAIAAAQSLKKDWESIGVRVEVESWSSSAFSSQVLLTRDFDVIWHSLLLGTDPDQYSFWHSTQAQGAGANISSWSNKEVDQILEDARMSTQPEERRTKYLRFAELFADEAPAFFFFSPYYLYPQSVDVKGNELNKIVSAQDRFADVSKWYIETKRVYNK